MHLVNNFVKVIKNIDNKYLGLLSNGTQQLPNNKFKEYNIDPRDGFELLSKDIRFYEMAWNYYCQSIEYDCTFSNNPTVYTIPNNVHLISGKSNDNYTTLEFYTNKIMSIKQNEKFKVASDKYVLCEYTFTEDDDILLAMWNNNTFFKRLSVNDKVTAIDGGNLVPDNSKLTLSDSAIIQQNCIEKNVNGKEVTAKFLIDKNNVIGYE
jgi:hypothetical protein